MSNEEAKRLAVSNFITKVCSMERQIELKRQTLCDRNDFEPYVTFQRLLRSGSDGITSSNITKFLAENLIDVTINDSRNLVAHYDNDRDGLLSYKEFLDIVLPKEHPDLRAFVTQRECFEIKSSDYLSYETEAGLAILLALEVGVFEGAIFEKQELDRLIISGHKIVSIIDGGDEKGNLNFNNIQRFLHECGLMPYDSEIINFLRRIDRDDDGVITGDELCSFLDKFTPLQEESPVRYQPSKKESKYSPINKPKYTQMISPLSNQIAKKMGQYTNTNIVRTVHHVSPPKTRLSTVPGINTQKVSQIKENIPTHQKSKKTLQ